MEKKFKKIHKIYNDFSLDMLSKGSLMIKDTKIGYWGVSPMTELFELFQKTELDKHSKFLDLGSGDGRAAVIADLFTNSTGIEFDEELHNQAQELAKKAKSKATFIQGDFHEHKFKDYDYLFIFPDQHISRKLEDKLMKEMTKKAKLVVFGPLYQPQQLKQTEQLDVQGTLVNVYKK